MSENAEKNELDAEELSPEALAAVTGGNQLDNYLKSIAGQDKANRVTSGSSLLDSTDQDETGELPSDGSLTNRVVVNRRTLQ